MQYYVTFDADGNPLEGVKNYKLRLPSGIPAKHYWSVIVYDSQTRMIINTDQKWPSVFSNCQTLAINQDGSVDIRFGPDATSVNKCNFVKTIPGRRWFMILRLYGPMKAWYDKSWKPGDISEVKQLEENLVI